MPKSTISGLPFDREFVDASPEKQSDILTNCVIARNFFWFLLIGIMTTAGYIGGFQVCKRSMQHQAVVHGLAHYEPQTNWYGFPVVVWHSTR